MLDRATRWRGGWGQGRERYFTRVKLGVEIKRKKGKWVLGKKKKPTDTILNSSIEFKR